MSSSSLWPLFKPPSSTALSVTPLQPPCDRPDRTTDRGIQEPRLTGLQNRHCSKQHTKTTGVALRSAVRGPEKPHVTTGCEVEVSFLLGFLLQQHLSELPKGKWRGAAFCPMQGYGQSLPTSCSRSPENSPCHGARKCRCLHTRPPREPGQQVVL